MSKVEDKYKSEINNSGGYQKYIKQQFNRNQKKDKKKFMYGQKRVRQIDHMQELQKKRNKTEKKKI